MLPSAAMQRLLALLALQGPRMTRVQAAGTLWPEKTDERALANLRSALWRLDEATLAVLCCDGQHVSLHGDVDVDVQEFELRCLAGFDTSMTTGDIVAFARSGTADLLPGWYDDWIIFERERMRQVYLYGLESLSASLRDAGRAGDAVLVGLAAVAREPLRESAHRVVIEAHLVAGNRVEARRQFRLCADYLLENLGVEPSPALAALIEGYAKPSPPPPRVPRLRPFHDAAVTLP